MHALSSIFLLIIPFLTLLIFIGVFIFFGLFILMLILGFAKGGKVKGILDRLDVDPSQENADALLSELNGLNFFHRYAFSSGMAVRFDRWRSVFNHRLNPSNRIRRETKEAIRQKLLSFSTYGLSAVGDVQTPEEGKAAAEQFGRGGEDSVWHNLRSLVDLGQFDIYRDVRIRGQMNSNQIDAIVVSQRGGVFLLEVKSLGGLRGPDGRKVIRHEQLKEDPANQLKRHRFAFLNLFEPLRGNSALAQQIVQDVVVFSYPHGSERRILDETSFSGKPYCVTSVDGILDFLSTDRELRLTDGTMALFADQLKPLSREWVVHGQHGKNILDREDFAGESHPPKADAPITKFCTNCGTPASGGAFCEKCGSKFPC